MICFLNSWLPFLSVFRILPILVNICYFLPQSLTFLSSTRPFPVAQAYPQLFLDSRFASHSCYKFVCIYQCGFDFLFIFLVFSVDVIFQEFALFPSVLYFPLKLTTLLIFFTFYVFYMLRLFERNIEAQLHASYSLNDTLTKAIMIL